MLLAVLFFFFWENSKSQSEFQPKVIRNRTDGSDEPEVALSREPKCIIDTPRADNSKVLSTAMCDLYS